MTRTYSQALKAPTSKHGLGWAHAAPDSMQASMARVLGNMHCLRPDAVYIWANRWGVTLQDETERLTDSDALFVAVINDWPLSTAEEQIRRASA